MLIQPIPLLLHCFRSCPNLNCSLKCLVFLLPWTHVCLSCSVPPPFDLPLESSSVRLHGDFLLGERNKDGLDTDELDCMYDLSMDRNFVWYYCRRLRMKNQQFYTYVGEQKSDFGLRVTGLLIPPLLLPPPPSTYGSTHSGRVAHLTRDTPFASP